MINLCQTHLDVIIGGLLGDGGVYVNYEKTGAVIYRNQQALKSYEYANWKFEMIKDIAVLRVVGKKKPRVEIRTHAMEALKDLHKMFYRDSVATVPKNIVDYLTPLSLAIWYFDDGYKIKTCNQGNIATCSFTTSENEILKSALEEKFDISPKIQERNGYNYLTFNSKEKAFVRLRDVIEPYTPNCMRHKLYS